MRWYFPYWLRSFQRSEEPPVQERPELVQLVQDSLLQRRRLLGRRVLLPHQRRAFLRALHREQQRREQLRQQEPPLALELELPPDLDYRQEPAQP